MTTPDDLAAPDTDEDQDPPITERHLPALFSHLGPIDELAEFEGNPRRHDDPAIAEVLREFGQVIPLLVNLGTHTGRGRELVGGHGRLRIMRRHGWQRVAWIEGDWTDAEARKLLVALNGSERRATDDPDALATFLLPVVDDLIGSTYELADLEDALARRDTDLADTLDRADDEDSDTEREDPDVVFVPPTKPITKPGDVWELGPHRVWCGNATDPDVTERLGLDDCNVLLTDPPYCSGGNQEAGKARGSVGTKTRPTVTADRISTRGYVKLMQGLLEQAPCPFIYVFTDWRMWLTLWDVVEAAGYGVRSMIVWDKGKPGMGRGWRAEHELVMWATKETPPYAQKWGGKGNVLQCPRTANDLHTTQKPVPLLAELLANAPFATGVYDGCGGSGSTLMACDEAGVPARVAELDPAYCDVIARRYQHATGHMPIRDGEPHDFLEATTPASSDA